MNEHAERLREKVREKAGDYIMGKKAYRIGRGNREKLRLGDNSVVSLR